MPLLQEADYENNSPACDLVLLIIYFLTPTATAKFNQKSPNGLTLGGNANLPESKSHPQFCFQYFDALQSSSQISIQNRNLELLFSYAGEKKK